MVTGQQVDHLHKAIEKQARRGVCVLGGNRQEQAGNRRNLATRGSGFDKNGNICTSPLARTSVLTTDG